MKVFEASALINAPAEVIWEVLVDAKAYPDWSPHVIVIEGHIAPGEQITIYTKTSHVRAFPVTVTEFVPYRRMTWGKSTPLGLFKSVRTVTLEPSGDGIKVTKREAYSGLLRPVFGWQIGDLQPTVEQFVANLKARAESLS